MINTHDKLLTLLFSAFIVIILGAVLIQPIGDGVELTKVSSMNVSNESVTLSSGLGTLANDELSAFKGCRNSTGGIATIDLACNITLATGEIKVALENFSDSLAYVDYRYEPDTYVSNSASRTLITLTVLFFVIAILAVGIGFAVKSFKEGGVM